ncbi:hypothetical protein SAMN05660668_02712 [Pseudobutyrivibrio sp. AR14]|uniref:hypothetical protein n=1 Tax=Pseudobutyrivibrio sp. AR14 TaxID=1520804 RepID=UPI0008904076|nr:hypothetical protein [Pseudobutyrivibrio sp. AR14]SCY45849.1 hypothetical protein SAMN05660668_02712 [Pseudobutyrivibrio sp. AR14]
MENKKINFDWLQAWLWPSIKELFISYLSIIAAFIALRLIGDSCEQIIHRNDILASIIITAVCIAWQGRKTNKYKIPRDIGAAIGILGIISYVLLTILPHKGINIHLNYCLTFWISILCVLVSIVLVLLFNYDAEAKKRQEAASSARSTTEETVGDKNIKL